LKTFDLEENSKNSAKLQVVIAQCFSYFIKMEKLTAIKSN
jgi:hypothetical protein